jgi:hypothetical protein
MTAMGPSDRQRPKADRHVWIVFRSYSGEWRWEERDETSRVVGESTRGFLSRAECMHDAALQSEAACPVYLH